LAWAVKFAPAAARQIGTIDRPVQKRIISFLAGRVASAVDPRSLARPLKGEKLVLWRLRVGDWRIICRIDDAHREVLVLGIGHRREVYR
jgi:mRNA interferase RelE/StbE